MKNIFLFLLIFISLKIFAQQYTVSGYILQEGSSEILISAYCMDTISGKFAISNTSGFYSITLDAGAVCLKSRYVGYDDRFYCFNLTRDTLVNIYLPLKNKDVEEVVVLAKKPLHEQTLMGKESLSIEEMNSIPSFLGETDIMKAIATIPGVSLGKDGRSDIYVRGGDRGQNLVLLDGAKLYNTNHIGGFFSLFNPSVVKQVDVYKGGFPARYGGRVSSVIDVYVRDGNKEEVKGKFNIGLLSSGASIEGPLSKKLSFLIAARTSYYDLFTIYSRRKIRIYGEGDYFNFRFYDANAKLSYAINNRNKIFINLFSGNDSYENINVVRTSSRKGTDSTLYNIGNYCLTAGNSSSIGTKFFLKNNITFSSYNNELTIDSYNNDDGIISNDIYKSISKIEELNARSQLEYYSSGAHSLKSGIEYSNYCFLPGQVNSYVTNSNTGYLLDTTLGYFSQINTSEADIFFEDEVCFNSNLFLNVGLRGIAYLCDEKNYYRMEPRLSFRARLGELLSFKANYTLMNQFNHVIISNFGIFEKEMWIASTKNIPPQHAYQFSSGLFSSLIDSKLDISVEFYYKKMKDLLEYKIQSDADIVVTNIDEMLIKGGIGEAYGTEFGAKWRDENFSTELSYILSWNNRQFDELNNGKWYPFIYDRRHNFSISATYIINPHYSFNSNFVFSTGTPYTLPEGYIKEDDYMYGYFVYTGINNKRLPNYHRLDIALTKKEKTKRGNTQLLSLNIYNVYARQNPVMIYYDYETGKVFQKSMFSIIPTISYSLEF